MYSNEHVLSIHALNLHSAMYVAGSVLFDICDILKDMDIEWCKKPEVGLPEPDAVIYLTLAAEAAAQRGAFGDERSVSERDSDK